MWLSLMNPITLRPVSSSISAADSIFHDALSASAQIENGLPLACVCERLLAPRHAVLKHYEDAVVPKASSWPWLGRRPSFVLAP